ncbi:MAG: hypothetical protein HXM91_06055 [Oribacterium sinus]|uniref:Uncharacterized protein n=1 Tax=Oribacterium sinus TaxID=237576 RepID=A0A930DYS8_9FIRM|nr:hypothetical protein [Oribacterium sinus]
MKKSFIKMFVLIFLISNLIFSENKKLNQTLILSKTLPIIIMTDSSRDFGFRDEGESSVEECYAFSGFAV